jgi:hypothetical protein
VELGGFGYMLCFGSAFLKYLLVSEFYRFLSLSFFPLKNDRSSDGKCLKNTSRKVIFYTFGSVFAKELLVILFSGLEP